MTKTLLTIKPNFFADKKLIERRYNSGQINLIHLNVDSSNSLSDKLVLLDFKDMDLLQG